MSTRDRWKEEIAARLCQARQRRDTSMRDAAALLTATGFTVTHSMVDAYEKGRSKAPAGYVAAFCCALHVSPLWMMYGLGPMEGIQLPRVRSDHDGEKMLAAFIHSARQALEPPATVRKNPRRKKELV